MSEQTGGHEGAARERAVLGHGLALRSVEADSIGVDLQWRTTSVGESLALVEGVDNLAQDLKVALLTPTGTAVFNTAFGFDGLRVLSLGVPPVLTEELVRLSVIRTLAADSRVQEVVDVVLDPVGPDRRQKVTADVRVLTGDTVSLDAGEMEMP